MAAVAVFALSGAWLSTDGANFPNGNAAIAAENVWRVDGLAPEGGEGVYDFMRRICEVDDSSAISATEDVLSGDDVEIMVQRATIASPYQRFYFFFLNDNPDANWSHPCRYVFVSEDMSSVSVKNMNWFPYLRLRKTGEEVPLTLLNPKESAVKSLEAIQDEVYSYARRLDASAKKLDASSPSYSTGDKSKSYFVLISGGASPQKNGIRFWSDTAMFYSTLTKKYGVAKDHIWVFMSDGNSTEPDANLAQETQTPVLVDSPKDLDGDGVGDIYRDVSYNTGIWYYLDDEFFPGLRSRLTASDQLFIFVTSHGGAQVDENGEPTGHTTVSLFNGDFFNDEEFQNWIKDMPCPVGVAICSCESGGFVSYVTSQPNRVIAASSSLGDVSYGLAVDNGQWVGGAAGKTHNYNFFAHPFTAAFRGYFTMPWSSSGGYPWVDYAAANADSDNNGLVSIKEAFDYAKEIDTSGDHPRYGENPSGFGSSFYLLKQGGSTASYTVCFNKNDGSGATKDQTFKVGETKSLLWKDSDLKWSRSGYTFKGWAESATGAVKYSNGQSVKDIASAGATKQLYAVWAADQSTDPYGLDSTLAFETGGDANWSKVSKSGVAYAQSGVIANNQASFIKTTVTGPCSVSFWWKVSSESGYDKLNFLVSGEIKESISGEVDWVLKTFTIPSGTHELKWAYVKDGSQSLGDDCGCLDRVQVTYAQATYTVRFNKNDGSGATKDQSFKVGETKSLLWKDSELKWSRAGYTFKGWAESATGAVKYSNGQSVKDIASAGATKQLYAVWAADQSTDPYGLDSTLTFNTGGDAYWSKVTENGVSYAQSGKITDSQESFINTTVTGPCSVSFRWKVSSEAGWDKLTLYIDSIGHYSISGETDWEQKTQSIPSGTHEIKWAYAKDISQSAGDDCGCLDQVKVTYAQTTYTVRFNKNDGSGATANQTFKVGETKNLLWKDSELKWTRSGYTFMGWAESASGAVKYANGQSVKDIASAGATKNLYAIWQSNQATYTVRFHKYDGSGATADQVFKVGETKSLLWKDSELKWSRSGYTFVGWVPWDPDGKNCILCKYVNGEKVKDLGKAGEVVHLYAGWKSSYRYQVCFNRNDGTGATMTQVMPRDKDVGLAWKDSQIGWTRSGYTFKGWAESASGAVKYANGQAVRNLAAAGATKQLYAVWTRTDSLAACAAPRTAAVLSRAAATDVADGSSPAVPSWAVGTFYGDNGDSFATLVVSADGEATGIVLVEDDTWTIAGMVSGLCIEAEIIDEAGNAKPTILWMSMTDDGRALIESEDGSICVIK